MANAISVMAMDMSKLPRGRSDLAIERFGDWSGTGRLVVCSPAMGDHRDAHTPLAQRLAAAGYRVATVDLRGHGDSGTDFDEFGDEATAHDLIALITHLDAGPAVVVGASMSAASAVIAASERSDLVSSLVLAGPFLRNGGSPLLALAMRAMLLRPWGPAVWRGYAAKLWPGLGEDGARERATRLVREQSAPGRWAAFRKTAATNHAVVAPHLERVRCASLIVMGTADPDWKDPAAEAEWAAAAIGGRVTMVEGAGHAPMLERPDEVATAVLEFLNEADVATRGA